jgi:hypothetical protein
MYLCTAAGVDALAPELLDTAEQGSQVACPAAKWPARYVMMPGPDTEDRQWASPAVPGHYVPSAGDVREICWCMAATVYR